MSNLKKIFFILLMLITSATAMAGPPTGTPSPVVIDVRTEQEWQTGHLEGAILIPHDRIGEKIEKAVPDKNTPLILYCRSGKRTGIAADALGKMGYKKIINLKSVENASRELGRPIVK